jgi:hypothetical protein
MYTTFGAFAVYIAAVLPSAVTPVSAAACTGRISTA